MKGKLFAICIYGFICRHTHQQADSGKTAYFIFNKTLQKGTTTERVFISFYFLVS